MGLKGLFNPDAVLVHPAHRAGIIFVSGSTDKLAKIRLRYKTIMNARVRPKLQVVHTFNYNAAMGNAQHLRAFK